MEQRVKRIFRWGTVIPMAFTALSCIFLFVQPVMPRTAFAAVMGALLLVSGLTCAAGFFFGQPIHAARLLAGVTQVSIGLWSLISCTNYSRSVLALGLGVFLFLAGVAEAFAAVAGRRRRAAWVRFVLAAGYAASGILLFVDNFVTVFPSVSAALITAGALLLLFCAEELFFLWRGGFYAEETLVYRPVRQEDERGRADSPQKKG